MGKFKIGDKVKIIAKVPNYEGSYGEVISYRKDVLYPYNIKLLNCKDALYPSGASDCFHEHELELVDSKETSKCSNICDCIKTKYKIGDILLTKGNIPFLVTTIKIWVEKDNITITYVGDGTLCQEKDVKCKLVEEK